MTGAKVRLRPYQTRAGIISRRDSTADVALLWTCSACDTDYDRADMRKVTEHARRRGDGALECTVCHAVGEFVDGPDA